MKEWLLVLKLLMLRRDGMYINDEKVRPKSPILIIWSRSQC